MPIEKSLLILLVIAVLLFLGVGFGTDWGERDFLFERTKSPTLIPSSPHPREVEAPKPSKPRLSPAYRYIEVVSGCAEHYEGECVPVYPSPNASTTPVAHLRIGIVLKVEDELATSGKKWYKIAFDEWVRYPNRITSDWYISHENVQLRLKDGPSEYAEDAIIATNTKRILIDRSDQMLHAFDGNELFMSEPVSTGIPGTPTPRGVFQIFKRTPSRYMQGPIPGITPKNYDLPGVPWNLYFTRQGAVIHGTYWHKQFGKPWSNGCVNMPPETARKLYDWAELGTQVVVQD